jgi:hypothetical protein
MHSNLSIDVFKKYFSYFCLVSYFDQKIEFTTAEIKRYIARGLNIENAKVNTDQFLKDLQESVCVIQRDGLNLVFTHRTFQEFFAAYCLARLSKKHFRPIVEKIANRSSDNVMQMLHDMNDDLLETEYIIPATKLFLSEFDENTEDDFLYKYSRNGSISVHYIKGENQPRVYHFDQTVIRGLLRQLFEKEFKAVGDRFQRYRRKDRIAMHAFFAKLERDFPKVPMMKLPIAIDRSGVCRTELPGDKTVEAPWFKNSGFIDYAKDDMAFMRRLDDLLSTKAAKRDTTLEKIFGIEEG